MKVTVDVEIARRKRSVWYGLLVSLIALNPGCASHRESANSTCKWTVEKLVMPINEWVSRAGGSAGIERVGVSLVLRTRSGEVVGNEVQTRLDEVVQSLLQRNEQACNRLERAPGGDWRIELFEKEVSTLHMIWNLYAMDLKRAIENKDANMTEQELRATAAKYLAASRKRGVLALDDVSALFRRSVDDKLSN